MAVVAVGAAATIQRWNPDWRPPGMGEPVLVAVQSEPPPLDAGATGPPGPARASPRPEDREWTVAVGGTAPAPEGAPEPPAAETGAAAADAPAPAPPDDPSAPFPAAAGATSASPSDDRDPPPPQPGAAAAGASDHNTDAALVAPAALAAPAAPAALAVPPAAQPRAAVPAPIPEAIRAAVATPDPFRPQSGNLSVARVDYDAKGEVILEGSASPRSTVRVRLDGRAIGEALADAEGHWRLQPDSSIPAGQYQLDADELTAGGSTAASVSLPFAKADNTDILPLPDRLVVQPGNSLWRLAERLYGDGADYARIHEANRDEIADPDLIFPGQIFRIPPPPAQ